MLHLICENCDKPLSYSLAHAFGEEITLKIRSCDCTPVEVSSCEDCVTYIEEGEEKDERIKHLEDILKRIGHMIS